MRAFNIKPGYNRLIYCANPNYPPLVHALEMNPSTVEPGMISLSVAVPRWSCSKWHLPRLITCFKHTEFTLLPRDDGSVQLHERRRWTCSSGGISRYFMLLMNFCLHCSFSFFFFFFVRQPEKVNWLVTVGKRFNWQVIMGCNRSNKEAWSRSRLRADGTGWLMSDRFFFFLVFF